MTIGALAVLGFIALFILADQYAWARYTLGAIILIGFILFCIWI